MKNQTCVFTKALQRSFLILLSLIIFFQNCLSQSCSDTAKKIDYSALGYVFTLQQHIISNDITFLSGVFKNTSASDYGTYIFKISQDGNAVFSKKINTNCDFGRHNCNSLLHLKNGNILLALGLAVLSRNRRYYFQVNNA